MSYHSHNDAIDPSPLRAPRGRGIRMMLLAALVALVAAFAGAGATQLLWPSGSSPSAPSASAGSNSTQPASGGTAASSSNISALASKVDPGLVVINTTTAEGAAAGTGMVVTSTGEVITNNHVISGASAINVTDIGNGRTYRARVVGYDATKDVAVLTLVGASGLQTVSLGDSSTVRVGAAVVTIGNAQGQGTMSAAPGTVTALNQSITASDAASGTAERLHGLIQIEGSLQPGDSGGPLVNTAGQVVGMDTAASASFSFQQSSGQDFAIPINTVLATARNIQSGTQTATNHIGATAFIGVEVLTQHRGYIGYGGVPSVRGAFVAGVASGTPAARAGLRAGDTITGFAGETVTSATSLTRAKDRFHPGDRVRIRWIDTSGASHSATVKLATGTPD